MSPATILERPAASKIRQTKLLIDNQWVDAVDGGTFETLNPATGEPIAKMAAGTAADIDKAVKAARKALESGPWARMDAADRGRLLFKLADLVEANAAELAHLDLVGTRSPLTTPTMSPFESVIVLPQLSDSRCASSAALASTRSASLKSNRPRSAASIRAQGPDSSALRAAFTALSMSAMSPPPSSRSPSAAGLERFESSPSTASTHWLSISKRSGGS